MSTKMYNNLYKYIHTSTASFSGVSFAEGTPCHSSKVDLPPAVYQTAPKKINLILRTYTYIFVPRRFSRYPKLLQIKILCGATSKTLAPSPRQLSRPEYFSVSCSCCPNLFWLPLRLLAPPPHRRPLRC